MQSSNGNSGTVNPLRADGLNHRKMGNQERLSFGVGLWDGTIPLNHFTRDQVCALLPGVTKLALYRAARARRNGGDGGDRAENGNGDGSNLPSPATLAADLIRTVGIAEAIDLLVRVNGGNNGG
jgi:hypothetical protein